MSASRGWMPLERWDALVRGEGCPLCRVIQTKAPEDSRSLFLAELPSGQLRLGLDQHLPGYCILVCKTHVREPHELDRAERAAFFDDMTRVGQALELLYGSAKINYAILGNGLPHLHCHIRTRYHGDPYPGEPVDQDHHWDRLEADEYRAQALAIKKALGI
jgi:diadenosine tetraphosphate (Ap4A) HIT family hydrolase